MSTRAHDGQAGTMIRRRETRAPAQTHWVERHRPQGVNFVGHHHVPNFGGNADPERPLTTMAVKSGRSPRVNPIATRQSLAQRPKSSQFLGPLQSKDQSSAQRHNADHGKGRYAYRSHLPNRALPAAPFAYDCNIRGSTGRPDHSSPIDPAQAYAGSPKITRLPNSSNTSFASPPPFSVRH